MDVGFQRAGLDVVWANEIDHTAAQTYVQNHIGTVLYEGDIRDAKCELEGYKNENIDFVFGGPPCQGFSVAGKMDPHDERSKLIWEYLSVVALIQPKMFVLENVKALAQLQKWESIRNRILETANKLGYVCFFRVLNSADYGVPQKRERVFFVGIKNTKLPVEKMFDEAIAQQRKMRVTLRECLVKLPRAGLDGNPLTCTAKITIPSKPVLRKSPYAGMLFNGMGRPLDLYGQANTLPASMGGNKTPIIESQLLDFPDQESWILSYHRKLYAGNQLPTDTIVPSYIRRITTTEAAAIQTFPPGYAFCGEKSSIYRQIGNAVPCDLAEAVARATVAVYEQVNWSI